MTGPRSSVFTSVRRAPRRRWTSYVKVALVLVVLLAVAAVLTVGGLWVYANQQLEGRPVIALAESPPADPAAGSTGSTSSDPAPTTDTLVVVVSDGGQAQRTAFVGIVQTGPGRQQPVLLGLPADLVVEAPEAGSTRLGEVALDDGADGLVRTVQGYTGIDLDHYVLLESSLLPALTQAAGGVQLCDAQRCQPLSVEQVADRAAGIPADATGVGAWIEQQRGLVAAVAAGVERPTTRLNPLALKDVVDAVAGHVTSDVELGAFELNRLMTSAGRTPPLDIRQVPGTVDPETGAVRARPEDASTLFQALRDGAELPAELGRTGPRQLEPQEVTVLVLNGVGTAGLASDVADVLSQSGFEVAATDNADGFDHDRTRIAHGPDAELAAKLVARSFEGARLVALEEAPEHDGTAVDVVVTVGADWSGS